jgi:hypothetical protein
MTADGDGRFIRSAEAGQLLDALGVRGKRLLSKQVLTGPRKIGKTRFLEGIAGVWSELTGSDHHHGYVVGYIDLAQLSNVGEARGSIAAAARFLGLELSDSDCESIPSIVNAVNRAGAGVILLYDHLTRALELERLAIRDYYEVFCEGITGGLRFAWVVAVDALDKGGYVARLRQTGSAYGAMISGVLDRGREFRLLQMLESDSRRLLEREFAESGTVDEGNMLTEIVGDVGGLPFFLRKAAEAVTRHRQSWRVVRSSFIEGVRADFERYCWPGEVEPNIVTSTRQVYRQCVSPETGSISDEHVALFVDSGLCAPDATRLSWLVQQMLSWRWDSKGGTASAEYYALLIDHENFWHGVMEWFALHRPDIAKTKYATARNAIFDHNYSASPLGYFAEHSQLTEFVFARLLEGVSQQCGRLPHYRKAYAAWENFSRAHKEQYRNYRIWPEDPYVNAARGSQAADNKLMVDMFEEVERNAAAVGLIPTFIVVSGDSGYMEALDRLGQRNRRFQYWLFEFRERKKVLSALNESERVWLEGVLKLEEFNFRWPGKS